MGNDISKKIFGDNLAENRINEDIRIFPSGKLTKKGGIQEKYLKVNLQKNTNFNLDLLSDFLANRLSAMDDADSLKIGNCKVALKKEEIKNAIQTHLKEI